MLPVNRKAIVAVFICVVIVCVSLPAIRGGVLAQSDDARDEGGRTAILWDGVGSNANTRVLRTKVNGGWFVLVRQDPPGKDATASGGAFFYPDPQHVWDGTSQPR
jgi:hypothetical protein